MSNNYAKNTATIVNGIINEIKAVGVPKLESDLSNIKEVRDAICEFEAVRNPFINCLIQRIGLTKIYKMFWENPFFRVFSKGKLAYGTTVQSIFVELAKSYEYDWNTEANEAELLYKREKPEALTAYFEINSKRVYKTTISREELKGAFTAENGFSDMVEKISASLTTSKEVYDYDLFKNLMKQALDKGYLHIVEVDDPTDESTLKKFNTTVRALTRKLTFPNKFNGAKVLNASKLDDQYIILTPEIEAALSTDVLAYAFNINFAKMKPDEVAEKIMVMDSFPAEMGDVVALVVHRDFIQIYERLLETYTEYNGALMYWNIFMHAWYIYACSPFHTAVALVKKGSITGSANLTDLTVGDIELDPAFESDTTSYTGDAVNVSDVITATPESTAANVDIVANGEVVKNGSSILWKEGQNDVAVVVSTGDTVKQYDLTINKA